MFKFNFSPELLKLDYCADYFHKAKKIVELKNAENLVTMQWFQREDEIVLCGIEYIIQFLQHQKIKAKIEYLIDGEKIANNEVVLKITGKYQDFVQFEGLFDGILAHCSSIATNCREVAIAAKHKPVINMADRADVYNSFALDGYASTIGGINKMVTKAHYQAIDANIQLTGTMPHSLIACFGGDVILAAEHYLKLFPDNDLVCLVDFNNDCVADSLLLARRFKEQLKAIRIDTSSALIDKSLQSSTAKDRHGVNHWLIQNVRSALDNEGFKYVKIIVSSGLNPQTIAAFEARKSPIDIYGVGEYLLRNRTHFTGDLVRVNGQAIAKVGRAEIFSKRLKLLEI